jgi:hypothetical protein
MARPDQFKPLTRYEIIFAKKTRNSTKIEIIIIGKI